MMAILFYLFFFGIIAYKTFAYIKLKNYKTNRNKFAQKIINVSDKIETILNESLAMINSNTFMKELASEKGLKYLHFDEYDAFRGKDVEFRLREESFSQFQFPDMRIQVFRDNNKVFEKVVQEEEIDNELENVFSQYLTA